MAEQQERLTARIGYEPHFSWRYLLPQYWGIWLGIFGLLLLAYLPYRWRDKFAAKLGKIIARKAKKQRHHAWVNLSYCFPDWDASKKNRIIDDMFVTVTQVMLAIGEVAVRSEKHLQQRVQFHGIDYIRQARAEGKNVILLVPHTWAIDASGIILHTQGMPMTAMYNPHRNPLVDWLWNRTRKRFGGNMHARQNGIKPFLNAVRHGELGYYLPDEDYGAKLSVYADFFATYKATLPGLNKIAKVAKAAVIPMFPRYNADVGKYQLDIHPAMTLSDDDHQMARLMNQEIESYVSQTPEQYVWILRLLKTRKDNKNIYQL